MAWPCEMKFAEIVKSETGYFFDTSLYFNPAFIRPCSIDYRRAPIRPNVHMYHSNTTIVLHQPSPASTAAREKEQKTWSENVRMSCCCWKIFADWQPRALAVHVSVEVRFPTGQVEKV